MIDPRELRIGNYVAEKGYASEPGFRRIVELSDTFKMVTHVHYGIPSEEIGLHDDEEVEPIPLTPEWLEKFGFRMSKSPVISHDYDWIHPADEKENDKKRRKRYFSRDDLVEPTNESINLYWQDSTFLTMETLNGHGHYSDMAIPHIKYVHQLQNLFFSLTGKELELKEKP